MILYNKDHVVHSITLIDRFELCQILYKKKNVFYNVLFSFHYYTVYIFNHILNL